jgi:lactoylglutathione lyase
LNFEEEEDMPRIVHIAIKVDDLEKATKFYEDVFGFRQTGTGYARGHVSRHLTDGNIDLALMVYDSEDVEEARLSGPGPCIHHWGIEVEDRDSYVAKIKASGGTIISEPGEGALIFRAPDGTVAEIVGPVATRRKRSLCDQGAISETARVHRASRRHSGMALRRGRSRRQCRRLDFLNSGSAAE